MQKSVWPDKPGYPLPIPIERFSVVYMKCILKGDGGFKKVEMLERRAHYDVETLQDACKLLVLSFQDVWKESREGPRRSNSKSERRHRSKR